MSGFNLSKFWKANKWTIAMAVTIVILFFCWLLKPESQEEENTYSGLAADSLNKPKPKRKKCEKKNELECKRILESIFNKPFISIRPDFLKFPKTKRNLEIDGYNEEMKLGFEYNGVQHYKHSTYFHREYEDFVTQVERDRWKLNKCNELGINIISIPYTIKFKNLESYIIEELKKLNLYPNEEK